VTARSRTAAAAGDASAQVVGGLGTDRQSPFGCLQPSITATAKARGDDDLRASGHAQEALAPIEMRLERAGMVGIAGSGAPP
jgi:hypothetical protein